MRKTFTTPGLAAFAAGTAPTPLGHRADGRPVYPIAGGAEDANPVEQPNALPTADELQAMDDDAVQTALDAALAEAGSLEDADGAQLTEDQVARLEALADFADAVDAEQGRRAEVAAERAQRAEAARARLTAPEDSEGDPEGGDEGDGEGDEGGDAPEADPTPEADPETDDAPTPQAVAAGGARGPRPARRRNPRPAANQDARYSLVAAADVGGQFAGGQVLTGMEQVAEAFAQRSKGFPTGPARSRNVRHQHQVASIHRNHDKGADGLHVGNKDFKTTQQLLEAASREARLPGGSLAAAGGWCAPSDNLYGILANETLDGIIDLPTIGVDHGGINFTPGPTFSDIFTSAGFAQTEAEAIAGTTKACVEVDCPDFSEVRLDAVGFCVKAPLLTRAAWSPLIQRWLEGTVVANAHKVAARLVSGMRTALGTALAPTLTGTPITWGTLGIIEWVIENQRQAHRLGENETLEVKIPRWVRAAIRADLANRVSAGVTDRITNALIDQHFADRGASVQWILNYLEVASPLTSVAYPASFEVMVYPAGTFVKGEADVVNLDTVYDTADLQTNVYTAAFVEDGVLLAKMGHGGARITIPVNVTGMLGSAQLDDNLFTAQAESVGA